MEIRHRTVAIALLVIFGVPAPGKADKIDDYITAQMERLHIPGASLAIVRDTHRQSARVWIRESRAKSTGDERHSLRNRLDFKAVHRRRNNDIGRGR